MPYRLVKLPSGRYQLSGPSGIHAKHSTKSNVQAQLRLLRAIEHNPKFKARK